MQLFSEETIEPKCPHFGSCGGCRFQNIPYDEQLTQKEQHILTLFEELSPETFPIIPCDPPWNYRNKMEFSFSQDKKGEQFLGLMIRGKRGRVVSLDECHLVHPWFAQVLPYMRDWWKESGLHAYFPPSDKGSLRTLTLREGIQTGQKMALLTISGNPDFALEEHHISSFAETLLGVVPFDSILLRTQITAKKTPTRFVERLLHGTETIEEKLADKRFRLRASSFFQPNTLQAEILYQRALELANFAPHEVVYDLYCGTGSIGIFISSHVKQVIGIELNPDSVADAHANIRLNQIENMEVYEGDVGAVLEKETFEPPHTLIVDPPRAGLGSKTIKTLIEMSPQKILYISCNPTSQVKDVKEFIEKGYKLLSIQPVDQFPHTPHLENIAVLEKLA